MSMMTLNVVYILFLVLSFFFEVILRSIKTYWLRISQVYPFIGVFFFVMWFFFRGIVIIERYILQLYLYIPNSSLQLINALLILGFARFFYENSEKVVGFLFNNIFIQAYLCFSFLLLNKILQFFPKYGLRVFFFFLVLSLSFFFNHKIEIGNEVLILPSGFIYVSLAFLVFFNFKFSLSILNFLLKKNYSVLHFVGEGFFNWNLLFDLVLASFKLNYPKSKIKIKNRLKNFKAASIPFKHFPFISEQDRKDLVRCSVPLYLRFLDLHNPPHLFKEYIERISMRLEIDIKKYSFHFLWSAVCAMFFAYKILTFNFMFYTNL